MMDDRTIVRGTLVASVELLAEIAKMTGPQYDYACAYLDWWQHGGREPQYHEDELPWRVARGVRQTVRGGVR